MSNKYFPIKTPRTMAISFMNDTFGIDNLNWDQRKVKCYNHIINYIASNQLTPTSQNYWVSVSQEINKL